jgi:hypothetical protein
MLDKLYINANVLLLIKRAGRKYYSNISKEEGLFLSTSRTLYLDFWVVTVATLFNLGTDEQALSFVRRASFPWQGAWSRSRYD